jgi:hypothetical protein
MFLSEYHCPDCGSSEAFRSRRRSFIEKYLFPFLLMQPVRCARCYRRNNASVFTTVRAREEPAAIPPHAA